jgi:hypothetical protein
MPFWQNAREAEDREEDQDFSIAHNAILEALEMMSFASIRQIVKTTFIPPTTVFRRLTKSLHFVLKRLRWVPRKLSDLQKLAQVIKSKELLKLLESMRHHSWKYRVTLGEAWFDRSIVRSFDLSTNHESIWLSPGDDADGRLEATWISLD